jgi:gallate dioxygenase
VAKLIGGIGVSHTPTIGYAVDKQLEGDAAWRPVFENFKAVRRWLQDRNPDALFVIYNDHVTSFFFDHYSAFALGVDDQYVPADEGGGVRALPPIKGHAELARHIGYSMMAQEFDLSFFRNRALDHGCFSPLSMLTLGAGATSGAWAAPIVPLQVGVLQYPIPTARRCLAFGRALRNAIDSYPDDIRVAILATGGLSHQVHGERAGFNNPEWDGEFLTRLVSDPDSLAGITHAEFAERGGAESVEIIMWLIMRGALGPAVRKVQESYYLPSMTAIATLILEEETAPRQPAAPEARGQLKGIENISGTYPFSLETAAGAFKLNAFLHRLTDAQWRDRYLAEPEQAMADAALDEEDRVLLRNRDWRGLIHRGATFFVLEKLGAATGASNLEIYAGMKGMPVDEFLKTRNSQITYSVAGAKK